MTQSRRTFLQQSSAAMAAAGLLFHRSGHGLWAATPNNLVPEPDEKFMREAAAAAMAAAKAAGASFADIRINASRLIEVSRQTGPFNTWPWVGIHLAYGVRAIVDGSWGFAYDSKLSTDAVAAAARTAVRLAKINRPRKPRTLDLAPAPVVSDGFWETSVEIDPYTIPLQDQRELLDDALAPIAKMELIDDARIGLKWTKNTVVFASTDGSVILQRLTGSWLGGGVSAFSSRTEPNPGYASAGVKTIRPGPYGYEGLGAEKLKDGVREAAERAIELAKKKPTIKPAEVGRYDLVFAPVATATLVANTLGQALDLPRAMGYNANDVGTSFAAPPTDMLGKFRVSSPLLTVRCDRNRVKGAATVGWDEEGVKPEEYTLVKDGVIMDYHTDRQTAAEIGGWYRSRGEAVRSHGVARRTGDDTPKTKLPNFTVVPGAGSTTVDDLIADTKKGYYVEECAGASDQQLLNTQLGGGPVRTIVNGKLGEYVSFLAFQFITPQFWKSVDGIGGAASAQTMLVETDGPMSFTQPFPMSSASSVPVRARQVNVMNVGRTA